MNHDELSKAFSDLLPQATVQEGKQFPEVTVPAENLHGYMTLLRDTQTLKFDFMMCLTGVDYPEYLQVVYHLESTEFGHRIVVKCNTADRTNPVLDTVSDLYPTAEFHECEVYDLLGIRFANHPDLRRFFLDDEWGHPLRKDYVDDVHVISR